MVLHKRDYWTFAGIVLLLVVLALGTGKGKGRAIPLDERHGASLDAIKAGKKRSAVELICTTCHSKSSLPLPAQHPPKEQCLSCHELPAS
jgi:hypothetical protein